MKKKIIKRRIEIDDELAGVILSFLKGDLTTREVGKKIGYTPQGVVNMACSICRQWIQEGHLVFYTSNKKGDNLLK